MEEPEESDRLSGYTRLLGGILLAIGILVAGASGLCTFSFVTGGFANAMGGNGNPGDLPGILALAAIVGGIPFMIGLGLCFIGRLLLRRNDANSAGAAERTVR